MVSSGYGYIVPVRDSKALARAIEKIITDDNKREEFGRYSRLKAVSEFDEKTIISKVIEKIL